MEKLLDPVLQFATEMCKPNTINEIASLLSTMGLESKFSGFIVRQSNAIANLAQMEPARMGG